MRSPTTSGRWSRLLLEDGASAAVLAAWTVADALTSGDWPPPFAISALLGGAAAAALAVRRVRPLTGFALTVAFLASVHVFLGPYQAGPALVVVIVATYSAAAHTPRAGAVAALAVLLALSWSLDGAGVQRLGDAGFVLVATGLPLAVGRAIRRQRTKSEALQNESASLQAEQDALVRRTDEERRRIARELHDVVSHGLGVVVLHAGVAEEWLTRDPARARQALRQIRETGNEAIGEMARLVQLMRDDTEARAPQPTLDDLSRLVAHWRSAGLDVTLRTEGLPRTVPAAVQLSAYRVAQEGLTNVAKHSDATAATVVIRYGSHGLEVEVVDNGRHSTPGSGLRSGLAGLRERVAVFGGWFEAGREAAGGWAVRASFPTVP